VRESELGFAGEQAPIRRFAYLGPGNGRLSKLTAGHNRCACQTDDFSCVTWPAHKLIYANGLIANTHSDSHAYAYTPP